MVDRTPQTIQYFLPDGEPRTLKKVGEALGLTRERVRQIETEALGTLAGNQSDAPA